MRVLLSPRATGTAPARGVAEGLAGPGDIVALPDKGVTTLERRLTPVEVDLLRRVLTGTGPSEPLVAPPSGGLVGYVCQGGVLVEDRPSADPSALVAVGDHANLAWRSPLWGPDDEALGPRFPVTAGLYRPDLVRAALGRRRGLSGGVSAPESASGERAVETRWWRASGRTGA